MRQDDNLVPFIRILEVGRQATILGRKLQHTGEWKRLGCVKNIRKTHSIDHRFEVHIHSLAHLFPIARRKLARPSTIASQGLFLCSPKKDVQVVLDILTSCLNCVLTIGRRELLIVLIPRIATGTTASPQSREATEGEFAEGIIRPHLCLPVQGFRLMNFEISPHHTSG